MLLLVERAMKIYLPLIVAPLLLLAPRSSADLSPDVFIGDSIIAFMPTGTSPARALNLGVSGTTTAQILASLAKVPVNARVIYVEGGVNDFLNANSSQIVANYAKIIAAAPTAAMIKVIGILPVNEAQLANNRDFLQFVDNQKIADANAQIAATCAASRRCSVVPTIFGQSLPAAATVGDGIHLNGEGYETLSAAIKLR